MFLLKNIFPVFLSVAVATTSGFGAPNCDNYNYRRTHPVECGGANNTLLTLAGGAALVGVGVALASHTSHHGGPHGEITNQNSFPRVPLSANIDANYSQFDIVANRKISGVFYSDYMANDSIVSASTINSVKSTDTYQRNYRQYDAVNYAYAVARGFSGANSDIMIVDNFNGWHGNAVHDVLEYVAPNANIRNVNVAVSGDDFESYDYIANAIGSDNVANIYNLSWQIPATQYINAATVVYNGNVAKTYKDAQSYMYNVIGENFINQIRNVATDNDAIFVFAGGNDGQSESGMLSAMPLAFPDLNGHFVNVVSVDNSGNLAWYSNQCGITQNYCIAAPGSAWNTDSKDFASGTSFATPVISGAIATIREAFPYMSSNEITQLLFVTATDLGENGVDSVYGWGLVNMDRATKPVGTPRIVLSNENIQPLNTVAVSGVGGAAIKNANIKIAYIDDFGRAFTTNLSDKVKVIPYGRGFDKLRESEQDSFAVFDTFEFGFKQNNLLESFGLMSAQSNKLTNFVGYKNEFNIDNVRFYQNVRFGITNPSVDNDNSIVSGFSNIYTASAKIGAQYQDLSLEIAIPETIVYGNMYLNVPIARANTGQMMYSNASVNLYTYPSVEYTAQYKYLSATYVINPDYENEFFVMAKTKLAF